MIKRVLLLIFCLTSFKVSASELIDSTQKSGLENAKFVKFFTGNKYLIAPFTFYMPETSWVLGVGVKRFVNFGGEGDSLTRVSNMAIFAQYSINKQFILENNYQIFTNKEKYFIIGAWGFNRFPILFYGVGKEAKLENEEGINFDLIRFENLTLRKIRPNTFAGLGYRYWNTYNVTAGEKGTLVKSEGLGTNGSVVSGLNAAILFDNRDNVLTPTKGTYLQLEYSIHNSILGSTHDFDRYVVDFRKYYRPFRNRKDVFAAQFYSYITEGDVPFTELGLLGGDMIMRGYYQGSFRDKYFLAGQGEYRLNVAPRWGFTGFLGLGSVSNSLKDFSETKLLPSYGGGLRFKINRKENVNIRIDYGFGNGQQNLYFFIAEAF
jgi:hypothetical protein